MRLHLGQVEIGAGAAGNQLFGVVEKVQSEIKQGARHGLSVDGEMLLVQVPSTRASD